MVESPVLSSLYITILLLYTSIIPIKVHGFELYTSRISIDYGPRYIGIAHSLGQYITPLCTIQNQMNLTLVATEIINIARSQGAIEIIVGIPLDKDGKMKYNVRNFNGILCLNFSSILSCICNKAYPKASVLILDERYTTREAKEKSKTEFPRASIDAVSAACLLQRYIEDEGNFNTLPALPCIYPPPQDLEYFDYSLVQRYIRLTKGYRTSTRYDGIGNKKVHSYSIHNCLYSCIHIRFLTFYSSHYIRLYTVYKMLCAIYV